MEFTLLHPSDQLVMMMERIYGYGMTTTSGGNLSILDDNGDLWITPAGIDKGELTRQDIVCVKADGTIAGNHRPSSEYPFHQMIYRRRPDIRAVVHAHPPALVAFSMVRKVPNVRLLPNDYLICGEVGMAKYGLPGSAELGENIADVFSEGLNTIMLENHGVVVGGRDLFEAFQRFETLEYCARMEIQANRIGTPVTLAAEQLADTREVLLEAFVPDFYSSEEKEARREMCKLIKRSYDQRLFTSTQGTFSHRVGENSFIITPYDQDRKYVEPADLVRIDGGKKEVGKVPSRSVQFHQHIYETQPHVNSVIIAHPPNIMAFAVTEVLLDSRTIPESYILLRNIPKLPYGDLYTKPQAAAQLFQENTPIVIAENDCVIVTGQSLLNAFDRLEVAEYSAKATISAKNIGAIVHMEQSRIAELEQAFGLK
ncbi:class II aldolase/adducin family protein [Paenibacillus sp. FSL H8-0537]|uniref:class II aldolase/adducin family protein n=1 Tax=Paenibacillus sp. FSL H8-0537 TaxID=2921399 RepID=UPI0031014B64